MRTPQVRELISIKCNEVINKKKQNFQYIGRTIPYGYIIDKKSKKLIIDKKCSHVIYTIFDLYDKGYGFTTIADYLNERGIVAPSAYKNDGEYIKYYDDKSPILWNKSSVRKIILNKVYMGSYLYTNEKTHEPIIDMFLWESTRKRLNTKITNSAHDFFDKNGNEFCGKVFCSLCGKPFTVETSRCKEGIVKYLRCSCYDKRGNKKYKCENKLAIRYEELRDIISFFIEQNIFESINIDYVQNEFSKLIKDEKIDNHRKYLKQERKELNNLILKYSNKISQLNENDLYSKILKEDNLKRIDYFKLRLDEIEKILKEVYSFGRLKLVSNKELILDKFIIDSFINKIEIGNLSNNERNINIVFN